MRPPNESARSAGSAPGTLDKTVASAAAHDLWAQKFYGNRKRLKHCLDHVDTEKAKRLNVGSKTLGNNWANVGTLRALPLCAHVFGGENKTPFKSQPQLGFVESA